MDDYAMVPLYIGEDQYIILLTCDTKEYRLMTDIV